MEYPGGKFGDCSFNRFGSIVRTDRRTDMTNTQTDRQTDRQTRMNALLPRHSSSWVKTNAAVAWIHAYRHRSTSLVIRRYYSRFSFRFFTDDSMYSVGRFVYVYTVQPSTFCHQWKGKIARDDVDGFMRPIQRGVINLAMHIRQRGARIRTDLAWN